MLLSAMMVIHSMTQLSSNSHLKSFHICSDEEFLLLFLLQSGVKLYPATFVRIEFVLRLTSELCLRYMIRDDCTSALPE